MHRMLYLCNLNDSPTFECYNQFESSYKRDTEEKKSLLCKQSHFFDKITCVKQDKFKLIQYFYK